MIYDEWGFRSNPFQTTSLPASQQGSDLLVGRDDAVKKIRRRIESFPKHTTVEGLNGVGKTSVVNVAAFRDYTEKLRTNGSPLLIPCRRNFQLTSTTPAEDFRLDVLMDVAQTLIEQKERLPIAPGHTRARFDTSLERWLNRPHSSAIQGGLNAYGFGGNAGISREGSTTIGFERSGFERAVTEWLRELFPEPSDGGVLCVIDNLELLQTSQAARTKLEALRDSLFNIPGIRWVLCGALGIVHGVAGTPRLEGILHDPIEISDIESRYAAEVFNTRVAAYRRDSSATLPLSEQHFKKLFSIYRGNFRSVLSACDEFCNWVGDGENSPDLFDDELFDGWLREKMHSSFEAVKGELRPKAFEVFDLACKFVVFSPSDCGEFGYRTPMALRPQIKALEDVGLLVSTQDDTDKRRITIQVTPKGWLVDHYIREHGTP